MKGYMFVELTSIKNKPVFINFSNIWYMQFNTETKQTMLVFDRYHEYVLETPEIILEKIEEARYV